MSQVFCEYNLNFTKFIFLIYPTKLTVRFMINGRINVTTDIIVKMLDLQPTIRFLSSDEFDNS